MTREEAIAIAKERDKEEIDFDNVQSMILEEMFCEEQLKPCPFCGCKEIWIHPDYECFTGGYFAITCENHNCTCSIGSCKSKQEAREKWNTRKGENNV